jgi:hypothetical protein
MGITILNARFLVEGRREGVSFESTMTLGRLDTFMTLRDAASVAELLPGPSRYRELVLKDGVCPHADDLFRALGAHNVDAMDASDFEGANLVHDLNEPLPESLRGRYDAVVDAGTLEHVFNVPTAFKNVMDALKVGGHFFAKLPANNWCGHGFYQFSAEFFYRVFTASNGFEMTKLLIAPIHVAGKWLDGPVYEVADPAQLKARVEIKSRTETVFLVQAKKLQNVPVFANWPQQSDYSSSWSGDTKNEARGPAPTLLRAWSYLLGRAGGFGRIAERTRQRRLWVRESSGNPALKPRGWIKR